MLTKGENMYKIWTQSPTKTKPDRALDRLQGDYNIFSVFLKSIFTQLLKNMTQSLKVRANIDEVWDLCVCGAGVSPVVSVVTGSVLQAEAGLVALRHWPVRGGVQQFVVAELVHAVVVPVDQQKKTHVFFKI